MKRRARSIAALTAVLFLALFLRLFCIQVAQSKWLSLAAVKQRAAGYPLETARGQIYDRNRVPLTDFRFTSLVAFPSIISRKDAVAAAVSSILKTGYSPVRSLLDGEAPAKVAESLTAGQVSALRALGQEGLTLTEESRRYTPVSIARHVVGYVGAGGDGQAGIEKAFDRELRGDYPGSLAVCVDATGRAIPGLGYRVAGSPPVDGRLDVVLTIDWRVQAAVERALDSAWAGAGGFKGAAAVVLDARTGEILGMASRPNYDQSRVAAYIGDPRGQLLNRAVAAYTPGSVFKVVTAAAAIEGGHVGLAERFACRGEVEIGSTTFDCASREKGGHGLIDFRTAVAQSCNVAFIEVGQRVGAESLVKYAGLLGFGRPTPSGILGESGGNVPDPRSIYPGDLANLSIGQWKVMATPLQVAQAMTAVVNGGRLTPVSLVKEVCRPSGLAVKVFRRPAPVQAISPSTAAWLRRALFQATRSGNATAAWVEGNGSAGKTGSAETGRSTGSRNVLHAWFVGYAPAASPRYVCCVLVEEGGYGGTVAAPVFRCIMEELLG
ncbi:MAG: penicillin-binding protein 2 [Firmicutes bacterium]|nr:penicillin-binding protein 2 [Bacillota bacterium]